MAEELEWDIEDFDKAFGEVFAQGMAKADFKARLVWLPNAIKHNRPESPNVVRSWGAEFDLLPECDLKREAYTALRTAIHGLGEAFGKAFDEAFGKPSSKASGKTMANQEQEQEQKQEQEQEQEELSQSSLRSDSPGDDDGQTEFHPAARRDAKKAARIRQIAEDARAAYNAILAKPHGVLATCAVLNKPRLKAIEKALPTARELCKTLYDSERITPEFWEQYFGEAAEDEFHSGRQPGGKGHENWKPDFEYLLRENVMAKLFDRAMSNGGGGHHG